MFEDSFCMFHARLVRHFTWTLRLLCEDGHSVHMAFNNNKVDPELWTRELRENNPRVTISVDAPRRSDRWAKPTFRLRAMRNYAMYFDPRYAHAPRLRANAARELDAEGRALVERVVSYPGGRCALDYLLHLAERATPDDPAIKSFIEKHSADIVLVSPLVLFNSPQVDYIKSARALGIPTAFCVASWDNLTNKGQIRELPDRVIVWNRSQVEEAVTLHGVPRSRVVFTGAQSFDHWFEFQPSCSKEAFMRERGSTLPATSFCTCVLRHRSRRTRSSSSPNGTMPSGTRATRA